MSRIPKVEIEESDLLNLIFLRDYMWPDYIKDIGDEVAGKAQEFLSKNFVKGSPEKAKELLFKWTGLDSINDIIKDHGDWIIEYVKETFNVNLLENKD
jgi:hypothetical protein